ncbi:hypothetical protein C8R43DRAFT_1141502 [Mycena crocata]|nr:hypothetical protein C8R43DRAFT_1141502 [Mycena crocata]
MYHHPYSGAASYIYANEYPYTPVTEHHNDPYGKLESFIPIQSVDSLPITHPYSLENSLENTVWSPENTSHTQTEISHEDEPRKRRDSLRPLLPLRLPIAHPYSQPQDWFDDDSVVETPVATKHAATFTPRRAVTVKIETPTRRAAYVPYEPRPFEERERDRARLAAAWHRKIQRRVRRALRQLRRLLYALFSAADWSHPFSSPFHKGRGANEFDAAAVWQQSELPVVVATVAGEEPSCAMDRARIAEIEVQIKALQTSICALEAEQDLAQKRLDSYIYPVLTLPNEIVSEIFFHFLPVYSLCPPLKGDLSLFLLTHICRKWRNIAHANPTLWRATSLDTDLTQTDPARDEQANELLQPWMARSGSYPLSIGIFGDNIPSQCMETLTSHRAWWGHLQLLHVSDLILPFLCAPMPSLCHLDVRFIEDFPSITLFYVAHFPPDGDNYTQTDPETELPFLQSFVLIKHQHQQIPDLYSLIIPALRTLQILHGELGPDPVTGLASFLSKSGCTLRELHITGDRSVSSVSYWNMFPTISKISFEKDCREPPE